MFAEEYELERIINMDFKYEVYTDGADRHKGDFHIGGWGAYVKSAEDTRTYAGIMRNSKKFEVTNNRMELLAIIQAVRMCHPDSSVLLHTDSEYSVGVLSGDKDAHVNQDLIKEYHKVVNDKKLNIKLDHIDRENNDYIDGVIRYMLDHDSEAQKHGATT